MLAKLVSVFMSVNVKLFRREKDKLLYLETTTHKSSEQHSPSSLPTPDDSRDKGSLRQDCLRPPLDHSAAHARAVI
jgi:hypothetical protein